jgi:hypothetical protein
VRDPGRFPHIDPLQGILAPFDGVLRDAKKEPGKDAPQETPKAPPRPTETDAARATKTPTKAQVREINDHLERARKHVNMTEKDAATREGQQALDLVVKYYGIDTSNVNGKVSFEYENATRAGHTYSDRRVVANSPSFIDAPSLAATVIHEVTHANQMKLHGVNEGTNVSVVDQNHHAREAMGYQAALSSADKLGLTDQKKQWYAEQVASEKGSLSKENLKLYESGQYWGMKAGQAGQ